MISSFVTVQSLSRVRLCDPVDCSTPDSCVLPYPPEFAQTDVHRVGDAIQPSHPLPLEYLILSNEVSLWTTTGSAPNNLYI